MSGFRQVRLRLGPRSGTYIQAFTLYISYTHDYDYDNEILTGSGHTKV